MKQKSTFSLTVWLYIIGMLVSGAGSTLVAKGMSQFIIPPCKGCEPVRFNHGYMQTLFMFIGEFCCLFIYLIKVCVDKRKDKPIEPLKEGKVYYRFCPHVFLFLVPTICDLASSTLYNIAIYYSTVSVYQILRNVTVIFVAMFSGIIWKDYRKTFDLPQLLGLIVLFIGATVIALSTILFDNNDETAINPGVGIVLILVGCVIGSLFYVTEEIFLRKVQTVGFLGVANEGGWGIALYAILLPIFNHFEDPFTTPKGQKFEDVGAWWYQMGQSYEEVLIHCAYILCTLCFNFTGMEITNHVSSATRSTFDACRTILIWIVSFIVGWEKFYVDSTLLRFLGFILVTLGVLTYNNVTRIIPFLREDNIRKYGRCCGKGAAVTQVENHEVEMVMAVEQKASFQVVEAE